MGEVLDQTVSDSSSETIRARGLRPAMQPKVSIAKFAEGEDLEYTMARELLPDIEPVDFSSVELEKLTVEVPESEVEEALKGLAARQRRSEPIPEPRPAKRATLSSLISSASSARPSFQAAARRITTSNWGKVPSFRASRTSSSARCPESSGP